MATKAKRRFIDAAWTVIEYYLWKRDSLNVGLFWLLIALEMLLIFVCIALPVYCVGTLFF